jgi:hydrogenase maturation protease
MNTTPIDAIARAVLYEGYMLYPYRPSSVKNRQRFNFGVLYPKSYSESQVGSDAWSMQTECLVEGGAHTRIEIRVRFLKLVARSVQKLISSTSDPDAMPQFAPVSSLEVDGKVFTSWQEAIEREVKVPPLNLEALTNAPVTWEFAFPARNEPELLSDAAGRLVGTIDRKQASVHGTVEIEAQPAAAGVFKIRVCVKNQTSFMDGEVAAEADSPSASDRDAALMHSLVSAHVLLAAINGQFVSLLEPSENLRDLAETCQNLGAWPVLVGAEGERNTMLASPIILYDYPQIAPESPGDLFDGTEIDEILALRILAMTEAEKNEMRNSDDRARKMLERTESLPMEHLMKLHGTLRDLRPCKEETP